MFNRYISLFLLSLFCVSFTACIESETPLSDPKKGGIDEKLIGSWKMVNNNGKSIEALHFGKKKVSDKQTWMAGILIGWNEKKHLKFKESLFFTTKIGENCYINRVRLSEKYLQNRKKGRIPKEADFFTGIKNYKIYKYEIDGDRLDICITNSDTIKKAIKAGKIKGKGITIDDTQKNLRAFVKANDEKLFEQGFIMRYTRVK